MVEVRKWNYGEYSSRNYGAHSLAIQVGTLTLYFSYDTVVAYSICGEAVVSENQWGTTTGKHLNWISQDKKARIPWTEFEQRLQKVLKEHNLIV